MKKIKTYKELNNSKLALFIKDSSFIELSNIKVHEGDLIVDGNYRLFEDDKMYSLYITGNLIVSGTLGIFLTKYKRSLLVGGNVKAKNFINLGGDKIFVGGTLVVEALSFFTTNEYKFKVIKTISTKDIITYMAPPAKAKFENKYDFTSNDFQIFKDEFYGLQNGVTIFYFDLLIKKLELNENYLDTSKIEKLERKKAYNVQKKLEEETKKRTKTDVNPTQLEIFKSHLECYASTNLELAGFKFVDNDIQAKIFGLHLPEDQLLRDVRSKSGLYALIHADRPDYIKPNKTTIEGFEVKAFDLLNRYVDLKVFIMAKSHMYYRHIFYSLLQQGNLEELYAIEKTYFAIDKELGLYWLIIFGLMNDKRFYDVLENIIHFNWDMIDGAKEYFNSKEHYHIICSKEKMEFLEQFKNENR